MRFSYLPFDQKAKERRVTPSMEHVKGVFVRFHDAFKYLPLRLIRSVLSWSEEAIGKTEESTNHVSQNQFVDPRDFDTI